jgi:acetylglutamate kinase
MEEKEIIVVKIGGSTLGSHDTTLADVAELHERGETVVVVHGGGAVVSDWLSRANLPTRFERGLRVTDAASLDVVVAVLCGLVNKQVVASLSALGVRAIGLSGVDGKMLRGQVRDEALGFVGEITHVEAAPLVRVMLAAGIPVIAPVAITQEGDGVTSQILNVNADTAAGAITAVLRPSRLIVVSDVPGVMDGDRVLESLTAAEARELIKAGVIEGGMIPKVEACLAAVEEGCGATIVDGRSEHSVRSVVEGARVGTAFVGAE